MPKSRQIIPNFVSAFAFATLAFGAARAQTGDMAPAPNGLSSSGIFGGAGELAKRHRGLDGQPCIVVTGASRSQTINPDIMEHWVTATNNCGQHIKLNICYYNTQHCVKVDVPAWGRQDTVLGIFPALREFRYQYTELFY